VGKGKRSSAASRLRTRISGTRIVELSPSALSPSSRERPGSPTISDEWINNGDPLPSSTPATSLKDNDLVSVAMSLHEAVQINDTTSIDRILRSGKSIHQYDEFGFQAIHYAVREPWTSLSDQRACIVTNQLLWFGADATSRTLSRPLATSLHLSVWSTKLLRLLLQSSPCLDVVDHCRMQYQRDNCYMEPS
jgi:hypothetical protein